MFEIFQLLFFFRREIFPKDSEQWGDVRIFPIDKDGLAGVQATLGLRLLNDSTSILMILLRFSVDSWCKKYPNTEFFLVIFLYSDTFHTMVVIFVGLYLPSSIRWKFQRFVSLGCAVNRSKTVPPSACRFYVVFSVEDGRLQSLRCK